MVTRGAVSRESSRRARGARAMRGFTLAELMIVVVIFAILAGAALPSYNEFVRNQRVKTASFDLFSSLVQARSEAVTRNTSVTVTPTSTTTSWAPGWEVKVGTTLLRRQDAMPNITITGPTSITYNGNGRVTAALTGANGITLTATGGVGTNTRCITVDLSGRPVTKAAACA